MNSQSPLAGLSMRAPPSNQQAEQALLGALLANNKAFERVGEFLRPHHFIDPLNGFLYAIIEQRINAGQVADAVTLHSIVEHAPEMAEVGSSAYLAQLLTAMVGILNAGEYGRAIHECWIARELIAAAELAVADAFQPGEGGVMGAVEALEVRMLRIAEGAGDISPTVSAGDAVLEAVAAARAAAKRGNGLAGMPTGIAALDRMMKGLVPEQFYVLGARPSMGKTALGLTIAARASALGAHTLFWSGEMGARQLGVRLAAARAQLPTTSVLTGLGMQYGPDDQEAGTQPLSDADWTALDRAYEAARRLPLAFDDRAGISVATLRSRARRLKRAKKLDLLVVDYIGLLRGSPEAQRQGRYAEITEISRDLLSMARELKIAVLGLAQLNRASETREDKRPGLADLRDSGAIEQDANVVMFVHRPHYYLARQGVPDRRGNETDEAYANRCSEFEARKRASLGVAEILMAKNRQGPDGMTRLRYFARETWFRDETEFDKDPAWPDFLGGQ